MSLFVYYILSQIKLHKNKDKVGFMQKLLTYHAKLPMLSSDAIKNKNGDWIRELHQVI